MFDEIQCGVGRVGKHFAYQLADPSVLPDMMVAAKPWRAVYLWVSLRPMNARPIHRPGHARVHVRRSALSCRVAIEFLEILDELLPQIRRVGDYFRAELEELAVKRSFITEIRSRD